MWPPEEERFTDRAEAGRALSAVVSAYLAELPDATGSGPDERPLILALPRGGVPVGYEVAREIGGDFDVIITRKIGLPWQPEFGVGAIAEDGPPVFDRDALASAGLGTSDVSPAVQRERLEVRRRQERYRQTRPATSARDRVVVLVDDGLHTGMTSRAAIRALRIAGPAHLIFAAPVCAAEAVDWLGDEVDAVIHVHSPREFHALGMWYREFSQITDVDVESILTRAWATAPAR